MSTGAPRSLGLGLLLLISFVLAGCTSEAPTATSSPLTSPPAGTTVTATRTPTPVPPTTGTLEVRVTDLPNPAITAIEITVEEIQVHSASDDQWQTVVSGPVSFDLLQVAGVEDILGSGALAPGEYTQIRLKVVSTTITEDGLPQEAQAPSDTLRIVRPFSIVAGETTIATLDFDAEQSVVSQGRGKFLLKPVVKLLVRKGGEAFQPSEEPGPDATVTPAVIATETPTPTPTQDAASTFFLAIEQPESEESIVAVSSITVIGRRRLDAVVTVGDVFAEVDADGRFQAPVQLEEGVNIVEVVASIESGEELAEVLVIIYSP
ncbi:MAG: DUF4382 domain-containing protein [Chloroflexi bacterium]|nr:DUF4382 domain-containing protein [Chloroflexota bacterium]